MTVRLYLSFAGMPDSKKSLKDVFPRRCYHPKMAMVIDDRLPVWEKVDQPRVHEVQAFMPYTEPKAEVIDWFLTFYVVDTEVAVWLL